MNPEAIYQVDDLSPECFFILRHSWIFEGMKRLVERGDAIDTRTLAEELRGQGRLDEIGGEAYLRYLPTCVPTALHAEVYGHIIDRAATRRQLLGAAGEIAQLAHDEERDIHQVIDAAEQVLFAVTEQRSDKRLLPVKHVLSDYFEQAEARREAVQQGAPTGLPTGFLDLDRLLGGLQRGDFTLVAGRPGLGKTWLLNNLALNAARKGARVANFSMEMGNAQISQRLVAIDETLDAHRLMLGRLDDEEWRRFTHSIGRLSGLPIWMDDSPRLTVPALRRKCRRMQREYGLDLVIVDYLQLMSAETSYRSSNRVQELTTISREMKELARELNVPVVCAAQLNRELESRQDKRPQLSDLKDSGSLEQDADVVMFIYRDEVYNDETQYPGEADIIVSKHRNGPPGTVTLLFRKEYGQFKDLYRIRPDLEAITYVGHSAPAR